MDEQDAAKIAAREDRATNDQISSRLQDLADRIYTVRCLLGQTTPLAQAELADIEDELTTLAEAETPEAQYPRICPLPAICLYCGERFNHDLGHNCSAIPTRSAP